MKKFLFYTVCFLGSFLFLELTARCLISYTPFLEKNKVEVDSWYRLYFLKRGFPKQKDNHCGAYDPDLGWKMEPSCISATMIPGVVVHTNSRGLRGASEYPDPKPAGMRRIVVLGDSFTFSAETADNQTFPSILEHMTSNLEVLNMGVNGYGHDQMLIALKKKGVIFKPDIVILGFISGDINRNLLNFRVYPKPRFDLINGRLQLMNVPVMTRNDLRKFEFFRLKIVDIFNILSDEYKIDREFIEPKEKVITGAILGDMVKVIKGIGAVPVFVYITTPYELAKQDNINRESFFLQFCKNKKIPYVMTRPYFETALKKGMVFKRKGHWDLQGNQIIAQAIKDRLESL